jgi:anti-anti-sigma regulatory factor
MKATDLNLAESLKFKPDEGKLLLGDDRMLIFRQEAFLMLRRLLHDQLGDKLTRALLAQFGYRCGYGDYQSLNHMYKWDTEIDQMSSGPVMHTWEGIVLAEPTKLEYDRGTGDFHMTGTWKNSYEAEIYLKEFGVSESPVCHTQAGYAAGWSSAFFGRDLIAVETMCEAAGDDHCAFEIRPPHQWGPEADPWKDALSATDTSIARELEEKLNIINQQQEAIRELSTPIMEVWDDVLVLPVVGVVDTRRSMEIMNTLLEKIVNSQSRCIIIDITGVEIVDTKTADYLLKVVSAAQLLGARCVLTGINPAVAQTLVEIGADLSQVKTLRSLKEGLTDSIRFLRYERTSQVEE